MIPIILLDLRMTSIAFSDDNLFRNRCNNSDKVMTITGCSLSPSDPKGSLYSHTSCSFPMQIPKLQFDWAMFQLPLELEIFKLQFRSEVILFLGAIFKLHLLIGWQFKMFKYQFKIFDWQFVPLCFKFLQFKYHFNLACSSFSGLMSKS